MNITYHRYRDEFPTYNPRYNGKSTGQETEALRRKQGKTCPMPNKLQKKFGGNRK